MILYRLFYRIGLLFLHLLNGFHPKLKLGYQLRQKQNGIYPWLNFPKHTSPVWFHCASGEFEYALPLIRKIKEQNPLQKILVTYFTPSYLPRLSKEKLVDYVCPAPWDTPQVMRDFIEHHKPKALLIARTDFWQEMTGQCYQQKIPTLVFSMTFNKNLNPLSYLFYLWQFRFIERFYVVAEDDKTKLSRLIPPERIIVAGDTRYEQCLFRLQNSAPIKADKNKLDAKKKIFIAGSLWPEDQDVIMSLIRQQKEKAHWIIVPHEIHKNTLDKISEDLKSMNLEAVLSSEISSWDGRGVLIINEFGMLAHLYKIADMAFVGGSFRRRVHSVMEPLATGCLTFVGPYYHNSREAEEFSQLTHFPLAPVQVVSAQNIDERFLLALSTWNEASAEQLRTYFKSKAHATEILLKQLSL